MWNVIWKQKGVYQDSKAVTEENWWSCSHPPFQIPCPLETLIKNNLSVVLILQSKLLNVFAAWHGRAIWFTNNAPFTLLPSGPSSFTHVASFKEHLWFSYNTLTYSDGWIQGNTCNIGISRTETLSFAKRLTVN